MPFSLAVSISMLLLIPIRSELPRLPFLGILSKQTGRFLLGAE